MVTSTEENYLKAIYILSQDRGEKGLGTNELAGSLNIAPATVSSMLKKLSDKDLISYRKYGVIALKPAGETVACQVIRKHRLWETFLFEKMNFSWDEIHEVAEQLEHIRSKKLVDQLDRLLDFPEYDPHGDPIPKANGETRKAHKKTLVHAALNSPYTIVGVRDSSAAFLQYATRIGIKLSAEVLATARHEFDGSMEIEIGGIKQTISQKVAENVFII